MTYKPKYIPFLRISSPPPSGLHMAEKRKTETFDERVRVDEIKKRIRAWLTGTYGVETVYVSLKDLDGDREDWERSIHASWPALSHMDLERRDRVLKQAGCPQFVFGAYYQPDKLFLVEDIIEWSHHRLTWGDVRTAETIMEQNRKKHERKTQRSKRSDFRGA
jgi:hypothetical protein